MSKPKKKLPTWAKAAGFAALGAFLPQLCQFVPVPQQPICAALVKAVAVGLQAASTDAVKPVAPEDEHDEEKEDE